MAKERIVDSAVEDPRKLFLIDGFGALLSAFLLGVVLVKFEHLFGIPKATLYFLASLPCFFAIYDLYVYFRKGKNTARFLRVIAVINLLYCVLSLGLAFYHIESVKLLGWLYILTEIAIVSVLACIELKVAQRISI